MKYLRYLAVALLLIFFTFGAGCQAPATFGEPASYRNITAAELLSWMEEGRKIWLVDVREDYEYNEGHIPDAILLPLGQLADNYQRLDPDDVIVLVCRSGRRSADAAEFLSEQGYTQVYNLLGGMLDWPGPVRQVREKVYG
jgi:rhodanese-related sulfurtransferase